MLGRGEPGSSQYPTGGPRWRAPGGCGAAQTGCLRCTFAGNMLSIDIVASNLEQTRTVMLQVKTNRSGTWQASSRSDILREAVPEAQPFWVFVDIHKNPSVPPVRRPQVLDSERHLLCPSGLSQATRRQAAKRSRFNSPCDSSHPDRCVGQSLGPTGRLPCGSMSGPPRFMWEG